jgi:dipeptidase D
LLGGTVIMDINLLKGLEPSSVFTFFEDISKIPRGSGNEKGISDYLVQFAKKRNLEVIQDSSLNVIIKKKGTVGYENAPTVIIQGHLDMVCEKNQDTVHDFEKSPLELLIEGDFIRAKGTTLGADNGIAIAFAMALLDSEHIPHPPLEILMTTEEETGMGGAMNLSPNSLSGKILINIDSEEEGKLLVSCAGGLRTRVTLPITWEEVNEEFTECHIKIRGLKGGHSGMDIDKQRGNANRIMGRILVDLLLKVEYKLGNISGGSKNNAIPRESDAKLYIKKESVGYLRENIYEWNKILKNEYKVSDPDLRVELEILDQHKDGRAFERSCAHKAVKLLYLIPNGIQTMSMDISGLVQSSSNLGVVITDESSVFYDSAVRSSVMSLKQDISLQTKLIGEVFGAKVEEGAQYPEWQYNPESKIREVFKNVYRRIYGKEAEIVAIHAGVECGLFKEKFIDIDMISFGPDMFDVHTPDERLSISSTERSWSFLLEVLKEIK